jgi:hypothetical protein
MCQTYMCSMSTIWVFCQNKGYWSDSSCKHIKLPRGPDIQVCWLYKSTGIIPFACTFGCHEGPTSKYADSKIPTDRMIPTSQPEFFSHQHNITCIKCRDCDYNQFGSKLGHSFPCLLQPGYCIAEVIRLNSQVLYLWWSDKCPIGVRR